MGFSRYRFGVKWGLFINITTIDAVQTALYDMKVKKDNCSELADQLGLKHFFLQGQAPTQSEKWFRKD